MIRAFTVALGVGLGIGAAICVGYTVVVVLSQDGERTEDDRQRDYLNLLRTSPKGI
jgi:hypothetical protein